MLRRRELLGAAILSGSLAGAAAGVDLISTLLHPLAGTALVLLADGLLERRRGASPLADEPQAMVWMATLSIFLWVLIEILNERRGLWAYLGWPPGDLLRYAALGWTFASILPFIALVAGWLGGDEAWRRRQVSAGGAALAVAGWILYALAARGPLPGDESWWWTAGVAALAAAGGAAAHSAKRWAAWAASGAVWIAVTEAINSLASGQRFFVYPEGFAVALWPSALLLGPALGGLYQQAAERAGLAAWPPSERDRRSDTILS